MKVLCFCLREARPQRCSTLFCKKLLWKCKMHCGCNIYRNLAVAAVVVVAFPISTFLSKFVVVAVQNLVNKSMSLIGILSSKKSGWNVSFNCMALTMLQLRVKKALSSNHQTKNRVLARGDACTNFCRLSSRLIKINNLKFLMKAEFFCKDQLRACWCQTSLVQCPLCAGAMF